MLKFLCGALLALGMVVGPFARAESVLFLNPGTTVELFWTSYSQFMQAAADDLHIDLRILYSDRTSEIVIAQAREALLGPIARIIWYSSTRKVSRPKSCVWRRAVV